MVVPVVRARAGLVLAPLWVSLLVGLASVEPARAEVPWPIRADSTPLEARIAPPVGFQRVAVAEGSFAAWLRALPVRAGRPEVRLFDGRKKGNQAAHAYVLDVDVGALDLQQCADLVMRLYAEHQWARGAYDQVCFRFTSGDRARWSAWAEGQRPQVRGSRVRWAQTARPARDYRSFRAYLEQVFLYAGTHSLAKDLRPVPEGQPVEAGDVFIRGGFPGHAVVVLDVAEDARGGRVFLLAQSFMPAQEPHVLRMPDADEVWYPAAGKGPLITPEWPFDWRDRRRFQASGCP